MVVDIESCCTYMEGREKLGCRTDNGDRPQALVPLTFLRTFIIDESRTLRNLQSPGRFAEFSAIHRMRQKI